MNNNESAESLSQRFFINPCNGLLISTVRFLLYDPLFTSLHVSLPSLQHRTAAVAEYRKKLLQLKELEARVRTAKENLRASKKEFNKTEDDLKSLQSVGQIIGEVLRPLDNERLIVKASSGDFAEDGALDRNSNEKAFQCVILLFTGSNLNFCFFTFRWKRNSTGDSRIRKIKDLFPNSTLRKRLIISM